METLQRMANRGSISTDTSYDVDYSVKLEPDNSEYFQRAASGSDGSLTTWTFSLWLKRTELSHACIFYSQGGTGRVRFESDDTFSFMYKSGHELTTSRRFRDTSAWYHIVIAVDTTQGTASNRIKIYINGVQETMSGTQPDEDEASDFGEFGSVTAQLGQFSEGSYYFAGYMAEFYWIDGTAEAPTAFGEFDEDTGIWKPKKYTGSFGSEGAYLDFADSGNLGDDESGNGNDYAEQNIAAADQATDTPTNNFCTLNPLVNFKYTTNGITEGGTTFGDDTGGGIGGAFGTFGVTAGKWYWECKLVQQSSHYIGVSAVDDGDNVTASSDPQDLNSTFDFAIAAARIEYVTGGTKTYGSTDAFTDFHSDGDIIGIALNMDDNQISIYGNGTEQTGVDDSSLYDAANKMCVPFHGTINDTVQYNFGGYSAWTPSSVANDANGYGSFEYAPPSGYYALCSKNLAEFGG